MHEEFKQELKRTGLTLRVLAQKIIEHDRSMLPPATLNAMMSECALHQVQDHFPALLGFIRTFEDMTGTMPEGVSRFRSEKRIKVTAEMREYLQTQIKDANINLAFVQRTQFPDMRPYALDGMIRRILKGNLKTIREDVWNALREYVESIDPVTFSEVTLPEPKSAVKNAVYAPRLPDPSKTARTAADTYHDGLAPDLTEQRVSPPNKRDTANHTLPTRLKNMGYVAIDDDIYQRLHDERRRTRVSVRRLIRGSPDTPPSLKVPTAEQWLNGSTLSAEKHLLDWVLKALI